jgi:hypothetical protein
MTSKQIASADIPAGEFPKILTKAGRGVGLAEKFQPGMVVATPGALAAFESAGEVILTYLSRHIGGDWGELSPEDIRENELSLSCGSRLLSAYLLGNGTRIWIITEARNHDGLRESTCVLLPSEY